MPEIIDITLSSSPPASPPRTRQYAHRHPPDQRQKPSTGDELLYSNKTNVDPLSDGELDVILMSSPAARKIKARLSQHSSPFRSRTNALNEDYSTGAQSNNSILDGLDVPDFPIEQPAKKRRLTPPASKSAVSRALASVEKVFDLSSEPDVPLEPSVQRLSTGTNVTVHDLEDDDDGLPSPSFWSSAPDRNTAPTIRPTDKDTTIDNLSDDEVLVADPIISSSQPVKSVKVAVPSVHSVNVSAPVKRTNKRPLSHSRSTSTTSTIMLKQSKPIQCAKVNVNKLDDIIDSSQPGTLSRSPEKQANVPKRTKAPTKPRKTTAEKEAEQEGKRLAKEGQAAEKQLAADKAEVNRRKTDRKKSAEEMIVCMPSALKGKAIANQVQEYMREVNVKVKFYDDELDMTRDDTESKSLSKVIKWKREVKATYDAASEEWAPLERPKIQSEKHILVYMTGEEFCTIAAVGSLGSSTNVDDALPPLEDTMKENLTTYTVQLASQYSGCTMILLIEGLASFIKRIANTKSREFQASVRAQNVNLENSNDPASGTQPASLGRAPKKRKQNKQSIDLSFLNNDISEILQLHLQLTHHGLQIHHTTSVATSAKQIDSFTQHLSTRPYRQTELERNMAHASFCMASGQFRTGQSDATETFIKMLEQVNRLTVSMAHGIIDAGYDSPAKLVKGFQKAESRITGGGRSLGGETGLEREGREQAKLMLEDVKKAANKDGAWNNQRLGPQISKRLWRVFMSNDEDMRDGIA